MQLKAAKEADEKKVAASKAAKANTTNTEAKS
jgi:hypothetical protein